MPERKSSLGWSTADRVYVRGRDLSTEILGKQTFGETVFLHLTGREPKKGEAAVFESLLITLLEHGLTPSALATRLTVLGAPESLQGAVAAGLLGLGDVFGGAAEKAAAMLRKALDDMAADIDIDALARDVVADYQSRKASIPGIGHPVHTPVDPRTERLWEIAAENGLNGFYMALMRAISTEAETEIGRALPVNATGAIGALCCELDLPAGAERGLAVIARAAGLVGHIVEESQNPIAGAIWRQAEAEFNTSEKEK